MADATTHFAIHIPWVMGLIGTRSFDQQIPGIIELVEKAEDAHPQRHSPPMTRWRS